MSSKQPKVEPLSWDDMDEVQRSRLREEIFGGGFGAELAARRIFSDEGFESWAFYYHDRDGVSAGGKGGTAREVDISAHIPKGELDSVNFQYHIIGEVKKGFTWVLGDSWDVEKFDAEGAVTALTPEWLTNTRLANWE